MSPRRWMNCSVALRFQGTYDHPMAFDRENRRHSRLDRLADSIVSAPAPNRPQLVMMDEGRSTHAHRLLDVYRRSDLAYRGSFVLPDSASRIAIHGDTLAVIAERGDTPVVQLFRLSRRPQ